MQRRLAVFVVLLIAAIAHGQERIRDLIYMKQAGAAFTMDVFKPKAPNGSAIIFLVSGGWFSSHENINAQLAEGLNAEGFTVFQVVHGAQPRYKIPEISKMVTRAIRFIRANSSTYGVDPERLGLTGASAGGHLSLFAAGSADEGNPTATDPVEKQPSRVAAVVAIFPPTDFLNYGTFNAQTLLKGVMFAPFRGAFGLPAEPTDEQIAKVARDTSPIYTVTAKFPPTLLIHGDADPLVPVQQSQVFRDALAKAGVVHDLMVVKGGKHDGTTVGPGMPRLVAWFKEKLAKKG
jgi:acetyl esterase/lipase